MKFVEYLNIFRLRNFGLFVMNNLYDMFKVICIFVEIFRLLIYIVDFRYRIYIVEKKGLEKRMRIIY